MQEVPLQPRSDSDPHHPSPFTSGWKISKHRQQTFHQKSEPSHCDAKPLHFLMGHRSANTFLPTKAKPSGAGHSLLVFPCMALQSTLQMWDVPHHPMLSQPSHHFGAGNCSHFLQAPLRPANIWASANCLKTRSGSWSCESRGGAFPGRIQPAKPTRCPLPQSSNSGNKREKSLLHV